MASSETISGAAIKRLTESCRLQQLHFHVHPDTNFTAVAKNSPDLHTLWIENVYEARWDECLRAVATYNPKLHQLVLIQWYLGGQARGFAAIAERCHNLTELHFNWACEKPGKAFCAAISRCQHLQKFSLSDAVTDEVLHALSHCHKLREVELSDESQPIAEASLVALAEGCPALEELSLPKQAEITMNGLQALSRCCPELITLECRLPHELKLRRKEIKRLLPHCSVHWHFRKED
jgi:hypothetical protein